MAFQHILLATDFSDCSKRASELAIALAQRLDAQLTLTHCWEIPSFGYGTEFYLPVDYQISFEEAAKAQLDETLKRVQEQLPRATAVLRGGAPWEQIVKAAECAGADVIVLGTHGRRGLSHALIGSVAERVVRLSKIPVLTARGP